MVTPVRQNRLYSFIKTVITVLCFAVCFYLFLLSFTGTFRLISDIGSNRVLFLNPVIGLLIAMVSVTALGVYLLKTRKLENYLTRFDDEKSFNRAMSILKIAVFIECLLLSAMVFGMNQRVDQHSVQYSAYGLSWNVTEVLTPPRHLGVYPNNSGFVFAIYLLSFITGHYNTAVIMLIFSFLVPLIYSDLAVIGGKIGMSHKSQLLIMVCGLLFIPLQTKVTFIYGDIPGLFFAVRAMKHATEIVVKKITLKNAVLVIVFMAFAYVMKNNYLIFSIAVVIYLAAELLRQRRYKELFIPAAVIAAMLILNFVIKLSLGAVLDGTVSSGASKFSWIAMGMQENAGTFNGYNDATYYEMGFDADLQSELAKNDIKVRLYEFLSNPNQAIGFYTKKAMVQWSDPTYNAFEFSSRNVYLDESASPLLWVISGPKCIRIAASFLKVFQLFMYIGSFVFAVKEKRRKTGTPGLLLITAFIGGCFFHLIWEAGSTYAMPYAVILIPVGVSGMISLFRKLSELKVKELSKVRIQTNASGVILFIAGTFTLLFAAAGIGSIKQLLADGRIAYNIYFNETLLRSREAVEEGKYYLRPAIDGFENKGLEIELVRYAGKYRMKIDVDGIPEEIYLTNNRGKVKYDWCSYDETQVFVIVKNHNGTYSICQGVSGALALNLNDGLVVDEFVDYTYIFDDDEYREYISAHPEITWCLDPVS